MRRPVACICLLWLGVPLLAAAAPPRGLLYDRERGGNGLDLQQAGDTLFGTLYTYATDGSPQWLWLQTPKSENPAGTLDRYTRRSDGSLQVSSAGNFSFSAKTTFCTSPGDRPGARQLRAFTFTLDGQTQRWCVEDLLPANTIAQHLLDGAWYVPGDPGWGLFTHYYPDASGQPQTYQSVYYHDAAGQPRWAYAQQAAPTFSLALELQSLRSPCTGCATSVDSATPAGSLDLQLSSVQTAPAQANAVRLVIGPDSAPVFRRAHDIELLSAPHAVPGVASTREGLVSGVTENGLTRFQGMAYARPPLGELRWRAPQPAVARNTVQAALRFGPGCPQSSGEAFFGGAPATQSEDCLTLNVWRPDTAGPHPVMVWIHGGGLIVGASSQQVDGVPIFDGAAFARLGVVFVSINYRLGPLGYLSLREFAGEAPDQPAAGNYGLLDQIAALTWVRDNIAGFGGDPGQVTIYGESAGGVSTCALLSSPRARGLFHRVIMQSGNCLKTVPDLGTAYAQGDRLANAVGCAGQAGDARRACLRAVSATALVASGNGTVGFGREGESYGLVLDGFALTATPMQQVASGQAAPVPLLIGVNDDEMTTLLSTSVLPATVAAYETQVRTQFSLIGNAVLARYPASAYASPARAYQDIYDDLAFSCANRRAAADHASAGRAVWHYALTEILPEPQLALLESFHGLDIPLLFGPRVQAQAPERLLGERMRAAWVAFARTGDPATAQQPWPRYDSATRLSLELNSARLTPLTDYRRDYCQFWAQYVAL